MRDREMEVAREPVRRAGQLCRRVRQTLVTEEALAKSDRSPVTVADYASQAVFCESFESGHSSHDGSSRLMRELGTTRADYQEEIWDHVAGWLLVEEAVGRVTDITGQPVDFLRGRTLSANKGMVVTNGRLHEAVLKVLTGE